MTNPNWDNYVNKTGPVWGRKEGPHQVCHWCKEHCGGTCLGVNRENGPRQMKTDDPAYWMLKDGHTTTKAIHRDGCYICEDPEFAQMGLPLCQPCPQCMAKATNEGEMGHIPADDEECSDCGYNLRDHYERQTKETG